MSALLLAAVVWPAFTSCGLTLARRVGHETVGRLATVSAVGAFVFALTVAVSIATAGRVDAVLGATTTAPVGFTADRIAVLFLLLVTGVSAVVQAFAVRYLRGDHHARRFAILAGLLTSATAATVTAATLIELGLAWTATSVVLCRLVGLYREDPVAREGARRTAQAFALGDAALWVGILVATWAWGSIDLRDLASRVPEFVGDPAATSAVACLLVVAAAARSAQFPLHGWLPATLAAPTPVSAMLHAGVVNGGGVLLITMSPLFGTSSLATHLAFVIGAASVVVGTVLMVVRPDIKGSLALSTVGQMGFMVMTCGLGAYAAAAFHLVAHGMYKASLFLGSGAAVARRVRHLHAPPTGPLGRAAQARRVGAAVVTSAAALIGGTAAFPAPAGPGAHGTAALLAFALATSAWVGWRLLQTARSPIAVASALLATGVTCVAYVAAIHGAAALLAPSLTSAGDAAASPWLLAPLLVVTGLLSIVRLAPQSAVTRALAPAVYVAALNAGRTGPSTPWNPHTETRFTGRRRTSTIVHEGSRR